MTVDATINEFGPEAVLEALTPMLSEARRQRIEAVLEARLTSITLVLEDLYDPHNGAAVLRTAEAFGLTDVHVVERTTPFQATSEVAIGAEKWVDVTHHTSAEVAAFRLRAQGMRLCATVPGADRSHDELDPTVPRAYWFGNEHAGLSDAALRLCDERVAIPMYGFTRSLNLSVSAAILIRDVVEKRRKQLGATAVADLPTERRAYLRARWYAQSVRAARDVVRRHVSDMTQDTCVIPPTESSK